jgi:preprotein translocase subunit Sec61beta
MAREKRVYMPSGFGGLVRYAEEEEELLKLKPEWVVYAIVGLILLELLLRLV